MVDVIGTAASVLSLVQFLLDLPDIVRRGGDIPQKLGLIERHVADIKAKFENPIQPVRDVDQQRTLEQLQEAARILRSIPKPPPCCCPRCGCVTEYLWYSFRGSAVARKVDDVEKLLDQLQREVVMDIKLAVQHIGEQVGQGLPGVSSALPAIPFVETGLDRSKQILDFLDLIRVKGLRQVAVGIYGQGGLGKTTLLNKTLVALSEDNRFSKTIYVQVGEAPTDDSLKTLQSDILRQMDEKNTEFPSLQHGQTELRKAIQKLKNDKTSLCMAVDNVWEPEHLMELLPDDLGSIFPSSSCILLTTRLQRVVDALECLCGKGFKVYRYEPDLLSEGGSREFFIKYASKIKPLGEEYSDMVTEIVPLCGRLPLTLRVVGSIFANESNREKDTWEGIKRGMDLNVPTLPFVSPVVSNAFEASYSHLRPATQEAFAIIMASLYGCPWTTVKGIVGEAEMRELEDSSLLSAVVKSRLNESRISPIQRKENFDMEFMKPQLYVAIHDLFMKLGKHLLQQDRLVIGCPYESMEDSRIADDSVLSKVKILWLSKRVREDLGNEWQRISKLNSLLVLILNGRDMQQPDECFSRLLSCKALRCIHLINIGSSTLINNQAKLSPELRELYVEDSHGVKEMPGSSNLYLKLERLAVVNCRNFTGLYSNGTYDALRELRINRCDMITALPEKLGSLETLRIERCRSLTHVPALSSLKKLEALNILECARLETLPAACNEPHPLTHLVVRRSCSATRLASGDSTGEPLTLFSNLTSLVSVSLMGDAELSELPEVVGSLKSLIELQVFYCGRLGALPAAIAGATSLVRLDLRGCEGLLKVADEIGDLKKLKTLNLRSCSSLEELPRSIGKATSLQRLDLRGCEGLLKLPDEIGDLKKLATLLLNGCRSLQELPPSIGQAVSLKLLGLNACCSLSELPGSIADLKALTSVRLWGCLRITELPHGIEEITEGFWPQPHGTLPIREFTSGPFSARASPQVHGSSKKGNVSMALTPTD